jgi:hypothetical protein
VIRHREGFAEIIYPPFMGDTQICATRQNVASNIKIWLPSLPNVMLAIRRKTKKERMAQDGMRRIVAISKV